MSNGHAPQSSAPLSLYEPATFNLYSELVTRDDVKDEDEWT
jgi:hypothetical protein